MTIHNTADNTLDTVQTIQGTDQFITDVFQNIFERGPE